jgi:tetratricopeptide (TPR) repeat protein
MSNFDSESFPENEWDGCGDLAWNEFDWERYLREQDDTLHRYLGCYERLKDSPERIDQVAHMMGWDTGQWGAESADAGGSSKDEAASEQPGSGQAAPIEPYTLHKNPVFIATKAIYLSLKRSWERLASDDARVSQPLALAVQTSLYRGEEHAVLGVQALDLGDYAMAVSLFKRALEELNRTLALASPPATVAERSFSAWRDDSIPRMFDLREIWLRVMSECREELGRRIDEDG